MSLVATTSRGSEVTPIALSEVDQALTAQIVIAWAGEGGIDEKRLGWWRSDLVSQYGGETLFRQLLPDSWQWAVLQGARECARRKDAQLRRQDHNPDRIFSLYRFGFELDERIKERFQDLKRGGGEPQTALPGLALTCTGSRAGGGETPRVLVRSYAMRLGDGCGGIAGENSHYRTL